MLRLMSRARGSFRLARGRCPACASEAPAGCPVCLGHHAPFPPDGRSLRRWAARFDSLLDAPAHRTDAPAFSHDRPTVPDGAR